MTNIEEIIKYVLNTPGNSNPNILRQLLTNAEGGSMDWEEMPPVPPQGYLSFIGNQSFSFCGPNYYDSETGETIYDKTWNGILEYSFDTVIWAEWSGEIVECQSGKFYLRGSNNTKLCRNPETEEGYDQFFTWDADSGIQIELKGNIEMLLDYETAIAGEHPTMDDYCFCNFFASSPIVSCPKLSAVTLTKGCYNGLFRQCAFLTNAPMLPATELAEACYGYMFSNCRSLTEAPTLPATTLAPACYIEMFGQCTSLTTAPALPATELAEACYCYMFNQCSALTTLPALYAVSLPLECYHSMFEGCTSIEGSLISSESYPYPYGLPYDGICTDVGEIAVTDMFHDTSMPSTTPDVNDGQGSYQYTYVANQPVI